MLTIQQEQKLRQRAESLDGMVFEIRRKQRLRFALRALELVGWMIAAALIWTVGPCTPTTGWSAVWAKFRWTNPTVMADSIRCRRILGTGDTTTIRLYGDTAALTLKGPGIPGVVDSAWISVSAANVVGPAAIRVVMETHGSGKWSEPSNALSIFYAARDTFYLGPPLENAQWVRGPGLFGYSQQLNDARFVNWRHAEVVQDEVRARLCLIYGYACRRGVRDTLWCSAP